MKVNVPEEDDMGSAVALERVATAEASEEAERGGTVVVGVRMDAHSRELLTWALVKVAQSGDLVIALHILQNSSAASSDQSPSSLISLINSLDSVLSVYEGFCNLKQIDLKLKVCRSSSLRKALVREAAAVNAAHLILGVAKKFSSSSVSIARYCAKRVPAECDVVAVSKGKIVFQRAPIPPQIKQVESSSKWKKRLLDGGKCQSDEHLSCLVSYMFDASQKISAEDHTLPLPDSFIEQKCSIRPSTLSLAGAAAACCEDEEGDMALSTVPIQKVDSGVGAQEVHGNCKTTMHGMNLSFSEKTKSSIFRAMWLPSRYSATPSIHPDWRSLKMDLNVRESDGDKATEDAFLEGSVILQKEAESLMEKYASVCRFSYKELVDATSSFSEENLIGKGGNSSVYKGHLSDGRELAVKVLKQTPDTLKEFCMEIEIITSVCHKNITSLLGFCVDSSHLLLVYNLLAMGSLDRHLHDKEDDGKVNLGWDERYKIAVGVAEALEYLHDGCGQSQAVVHRDVKSSNILLSKDFEPQLSDFGFATWASSSSSLITCTSITGTFGYLAPEYFLFGKVTEKIDVYAFGVVLLELLTGRKAIRKEAPKGQESLVMWAKPFLQNEKGRQLLDPSLGIGYDDDRVEMMVLAISLCTRRAPKLRPKMTFVVNLLLGNMEAITSARLQAKTSEGPDGQDDETSYPVLSNIQSHLSLALLDVEDDVLNSAVTSALVP